MRTPGAFTLALTTLLGCGGGGGSAGPSSTTDNSNGDGAGVTRTVSCPRSEAELFESESGFRCTTTTTVTDVGDGSEEQPTGSIEINHYAEFEPNDDFANANIVEFPTVAEPTSIGVQISGSVQQGDDPADFIIFTPPRTATYLVYLCTDTCIEHPTDDQVSLLIYDTNQNLIKATPSDQASEKMLFQQFEQGLVYYVELRGYNTGDTAYPYRLVVNE